MGFTEGLRNLGRSLVGKGQSKEQLFEEGEVSFDPSRLPVEELLERWKNMERTTLNRSGGELNGSIQDALAEKLASLEEEARRNLYTQAGVNPDEIEDFLRKRKSEVV